MDGRLTITEVAKYIGVTPRTIMRWEKNGKIRRSRRDWRGWRFYLKEDMEDIRKFYESIYEYSEGGVKVMDLTKGTIIAILILGASLSLPIICGHVYAQGAASQTPGVTETKSSIDINLAKLPTQGTPPNVAEASKYTLGAEDVIQIEVRRHPEFSGQYMVTSEGKIEYKFIGDVIVEGLTKVQLQERLTGILSEYIIEPEVNVQIMAYLSKVFYVVGEVNRPGKFYMKGNSINVLEAIVQAGLPNTSASLRKCRLITPSGKHKNKLAYVNAYELLYAGDMRENKEMKPGEILYVPSTVIAKIIRVISPVTNFAAETAGHAAQGAAIAAL